MFSALRKRLFGDNDSSKIAAKSRLHFVLVQDRTGLTNEEMAGFREEMVKVIEKYFVIDKEVDEGTTLELGKLKIQVWHTPGHAVGQLAFRLGNLLFSGDNIFRDGCVGSIDAHHGSDLPAFIDSLKRIQKSSVEWLLPSHGPAFRNEPKLLQSAIDRLDKYQHMADFGTCAVDWPLLDEWEAELAKGQNPAAS